MLFVVYLFFFKQKTAYEMRISDWSSDVCSSDLLRAPAGRCPPSGARLAHTAPGHAAPLPSRAHGQAGGARVGIDALQQRHDAPLAMLDMRMLLVQIGRASCRERVCQYV